MTLFRGYKLEETEYGVTLVLFLNLHSTEFSKEAVDVNTTETIGIKEIVQDYVKENFKDIKITAVKLILGSILISTIGLGGAVTATENSAVVTESTVASSYTVQAGDTLWLISQKTGVSISEIKRINNLTNDMIYIGQKLLLSESQPSTIIRTENQYYSVLTGDTLWIISQKFGLSIEGLKSLNNLTTDMIYPGQRLIVKQIKTEGISYTVKAGDTLWKIAQNNNSTIDSIKIANNLTTDMLMIGQVLFIPINTIPNEPEIPAPKPIYNWPDVTYIVQPGDTVLGVAKKFNISMQNILEYNYMEPNEWLNAGDKIAISGFAPRVYTVTPGEATEPARLGKVVDWINEGQYILKRGEIFTVVDVDTGKQFRAQMIGGYNHSDIEPLTATDTAVMKDLFGNWQWNPRAVVIFIDGINIAASLSGMPHDVDVVANNDVIGHFDMYLLNSSPHGSASTSYVDLHQSMVLKAGGR